MWALRGNTPEKWIEISRYRRVASGILGNRGSPDGGALFISRRHRPFRTGVLFYSYPGGIVFFARAYVGGRLDAWGTRYQRFCVGVCVGG